MKLGKKEIEGWLRIEDLEALKELWAKADEVRRENVGDEVHLRGLIEISNHCSRVCHYCGINAQNGKLSRYRLTLKEILDSARLAKRLGYGTVVLQSGEDPGISREWMREAVTAIKDETELAITLSLGERPTEDLLLWKQAGADRYLLKFETSDTDLYRRIHPPLPHRPLDRLDILRTLHNLGYEVGSGVMIGIPGQTYESLASDIELFCRLNLDMIGVGPYLPHPDTVLVRQPEKTPTPGQVPNTELMTYKVVALTRIICPWSNIPATTALASLNPDEGRILGLQRGANVVMPNLTPSRYRAQYEIYPAKACVSESSAVFDATLKQRILSIGRQIGRGPGSSRSP